MKALTSIRIRMKGLKCLDMEFLKTVDKICIYFKKQINKITMEMSILASSILINYFFKILELNFINSIQNLNRFWNLDQLEKSI
jgi:hypothetical protein